MPLDDADRRAIAASFNQGANVASGGSGAAGRWTAVDLGYDDPILLAQINAGIDAGLIYSGAVGGGNGSGGPPSSAQTWDPTTGLTANSGGKTGASAGGLCDDLPFPFNTLCKAAGDYVGNKINNSGSTTPAGGGSTGCPTGYHKNATGGCVIDGVGSYIPGDVGMPDYVWTPVNGYYGAGLTPVLVQRNVRACPPGHKLGKDGVCYRHIANTNRAHNPGHKPFLTGGEMNALRTANRLRKKGRKLARTLGIKATHTTPPKARGKR